MRNRHSRSLDRMPSRLAYLPLRLTEKNVAPSYLLFAVATPPRSPTSMFGDQCVRRVRASRGHTPGCLCVDAASHPNKLEWPAAPKRKKAKTRPTKCANALPGKGVRAMRGFRKLGRGSLKTNRFARRDVHASMHLVRAASTRRGWSGKFSRERRMD